MLNRINHQSKMHNLFWRYLFFLVAFFFSCFEYCFVYVSSFFFVVMNSSMNRLIIIPFLFSNKYYLCMFLFQHEKRNENENPNSIYFSREFITWTIYLLIEKKQPNIRWWFGWSFLFSKQLVSMSSLNSINVKEYVKKTKMTKISYVDHMTCFSFFVFSFVSI